MRKSNIDILEEEYMTKEEVINKIRNLENNTMTIVTDIKEILVRPFITRQGTILRNNTVRTALKYLKERAKIETDETFSPIMYICDFFVSNKMNFNYNSLMTFCANLREVVDTFENNTLAKEIFEEAVSVKQMNEPSLRRSKVDTRDLFRSYITVEIKKLVPGTKDEYKLTNADRLTAAKLALEFMVEKDYPLDNFALFVTVADYQILKHNLDCLPYNYQATKIVSNSSKEVKKR